MTIATTTRPMTVICQHFTMCQTPLCVFYVSYFCVLQESLAASLSYFLNEETNDDTWFNTQSN